MRLWAIAGLMLSVLASASVAAQTELDPENALFLDLKDGRVVIRMYPQVAPVTVERIKTLTRQGFYDGLTFHRVLPGFMAQTGDPKGDGSGESDLPDLPDEFNRQLHMRGTVSMANTGEPNSANSQFFIMFNDKRELNGKYTVWGRVVDGMEFVDNIKKGNEELDGLVEGEPDRIVRMRVVADTLAEEATSSVEQSATESGE